MGDVLDVKYFGLDPRTRKEKVSRKAILPKPEGFVERPPEITIVEETIEVEEIIEVVIIEEMIAEMTGNQEKKKRKIKYFLLHNKKSPKYFGDFFIS